MTIIADFVVEGRPEPKGSWTPVAMGKRIVLLPARAKNRKDGTRSTEARDRYEAWTRSVTAAATAWQLVHRRKVVDDEPLSVQLGFFVPKPLSSRDEYPIRRPDLDKLTRLALDCLTKARLIADDARIVDLTLSKRFGKPHARIIVSSLEDAA